MRHSPDTRIDVKCYAAPWENTTTDVDRAIDLAYSLSEEYQCDVDLRYNSTGIIFQTVSNYWIMTQTTLTFEEIDALLKFIEFHTDSFNDEESAEELNEIVGCDVDALYNKLSEMQDEVWCYFK